MKHDEKRESHLASLYNKWAKALVDFGYPGVTADMIREVHEAYDAKKPFLTESSACS